MSYLWKVEPICERQLRDVQPKDLVKGNLYRLCDVYKSGGGYDKLPDIIQSRFGYRKQDYKKQFVVQLKGCCFRCPYCYVTKDGINGKETLVNTEQLVSDFILTGVNVFHLMGGSPMLYVEHWQELIKELSKRKPETVFHSDILLYEKEYTDEMLEEIALDNCVYAISIKGHNPTTYMNNTGIDVFDEEKFKNNLEVLKRSKLNYYITFTGMTQEEVNQFTNHYGISEEMMRDSFIINLVQYDALK